jgi:hypothetical protein
LRRWELRESNKFLAKPQSEIISHNSCDITIKIFTQKLTNEFTNSSNKTIFEKAGTSKYSTLDLLYIFFSTKVNLKNEGNLYSACSNPINVVLVIVLVIALAINFGGPNIKHSCLKSYLRQSLRQHQ